MRPWNTSTAEVWGWATRCSIGPRSVTTPDAGADTSAGGVEQSGDRQLFGQLGFAGVRRSGFGESGAARLSAWQHPFLHLDGGSVGA